MTIIYHTKISNSEKKQEQNVLFQENLRNRKWLSRGKCKKPEIY